MKPTGTERHIITHVWTCFIVITAVPSFVEQPMPKEREVAVLSLSVLHRQRERETFNLQKSRRPQYFETAVLTRKDILEKIINMTDDDAHEIDHDRIAQ